MTFPNGGFPLVIKKKSINKKSDKKRNYQNNITMYDLLKINSENPVVNLKDNKIKIIKEL